MWVQFQCGLERSPGGGHSNPLQYSCLDKPMDRGPWRAVVMGLHKYRTQLSTHIHSISYYQIIATVTSSLPNILSRDPNPFNLF